MYLRILFTMKLIIVLCIVGYGLANTNENDDCKRNDFRILDSIHQEENCSRQGGICTIDCPEGKLANRGLCPKQRSMGVECCYGQSDKETRCLKRGGSCSKNPCLHRLIFPNATDCPEKTTCCILVN